LGGPPLFFWGLKVPTWWGCRTNFGTLFLPLGGLSLGGKENPLLSVFWNIWVLPFVSHGGTLWEPSCGFSGGPTYFSELTVRVGDPPELISHTGKGFVRGLPFFFFPVSTSLCLCRRGGLPPL